MGGYGRSERADSLPWPWLHGPQATKVGYVILEDHQGEGERIQEITIPFSKPFGHTAQVATFLSGFKINPDGDSYCLMVLNYQK